MFERYTETARRVVFFARYEASQTGSAYIECDHLLLGMLHEHTPLREQFGPEQREQLREALIAPFRGNTRLPTSVDLPVSSDAQRALAYAAEEAVQVGSAYIDPGHLLLGILRVGATAADVLLKHGVDLTSERQKVLRGIGYEGPQTEVASAEGDEMASPPVPVAASLRDVIQRLSGLIERTLTHLDRSPESGEQRLKRKSWSRKQAIGHLIDWAMMHQQLFARALTEPNVTMPVYPQDAWVEAQDYSSLPWAELVGLWATVNRFLVHVLARIPLEKLIVPCRIGVAAPVPLATIIDQYVDHCDDVIAQILLHPGK